MRNYKVKKTYNEGMETAVVVVNENDEIVAAMPHSYTQFGEQGRFIRDVGAEYAMNKLAEFLNEQN